ncbi:hypothetical protein ACFLS7_06390 [Bacteroidota bacterium]
MKFNVLNPNIPKIRSNPLLEWEQLTNESTGEIKEQTAYYHEMKFVIKNDKYLRVSGSLHKHWNSLQTGVKHNYNDFGFSSMVNTVMGFCSTFEINPSSCKLENIEFGVNITPNIPSEEILQSCIDHKGKPFTHQYSDSKNFRECIHQRYIIKIYNKAIQYNRLVNILRFEIKTMKMAHLKSIGIKTLEDILNHDKLKMLGDNLLATFNDILFYNFAIDLDQIPERDRTLLSLGISPRYWLDLNNRNKNTCKKQRSQFRQLVNQYESLPIQQQIGELIRDKWQELISQRTETVSTYSNLATREYTQINTSDKGLIQIHNKETDSNQCIGGGFLPSKEETDRKILPLHGKGREWKH